MRKTGKSLILCVCILTMLMNSMGISAALPLTNYVEKSTPEYFDYDYTTHILSNVNNNCFLYPYALRIGDSFKVSYAGGGDNPFVNISTGSVTAELYDIIGVPHGDAISAADDKLKLEDNSAAKMLNITAIQEGTYCVKFTEAGGGSKVSYVYVVVVPDGTDDYTLELPERASLNVPNPGKGETYVGQQLLLQPLAIDQVVTVKMYVTEKNYGSSEGLRLDGYDFGSSQPSIAELELNGAVADENNSPKGRLIPFDDGATGDDGSKEGYCTIGTITGIDKGYTYVRFRIPGFGSKNEDGIVTGKVGAANKLFLVLEVPVGYKLPTVKNAITSSAYGVRNGYNGANGEKPNVVFANYYDNMKDNVNGSVKGVTSAGKRAALAFNGLLSDYNGYWNFLTMSRDVGQDEHFTVYQYDEPFMIDEITAFFNNNTNTGRLIEEKAPDAVRIDISTDNYVLPNRDVYNYVVREGTVVSTSNEGKTITVNSTNQANDVKAGQYLVIGGEKRKIPNNIGGGPNIVIESAFSQDPETGTPYEIRQYIETIERPTTGSYADITGEKVTAVVLPADTNAISATGPTTSNSGLNEISGNLSYMYLVVNDDRDNPKKVLKYDYSRGLLIVDGEVQLNARDKYSIESWFSAQDGTRTRVQLNDNNALDKIHVQNIHDDGGNRYAGYYLTIEFEGEKETRKIIASGKDAATSHTALTVDEPFSFSEVPVASTDAIISVENPEEEMSFPSDGISLHAIDVDWVNSQGIYDGNYLNLPISEDGVEPVEYERREIIHYDKTGKRGTIYTLPFTTYPVVGTEGFVDSNGYDGQTLLQNEAVLRESTYNELRHGTDTLEWKTIYEKGFERDENLWDGGDDVHKEKVKLWGENIPNRLVVTQEDIKNYIEVNYPSNEQSEILQPTTLVKITYIRGAEFDEDDRRIMDPTKQICLGEVYLNTLETVDEEAFEPIFDAENENQLTGVRVASLDGSYFNASCAVALYNDGRLQAAELKRGDVNAHVNTVITFDSPIDVSDYDYKIFLWSSEFSPVFIYQPSDDTDDSQDIENTE